MTAVDWDRVWTQVAHQLSGYQDIGLERLLTEDVLRFSAIQQLVAVGVDPSVVEVEWRRPGVRDSVDLVLTGTPPAAVEFKFPREPRTTNPPLTQHLGEALKDFYRLATMPAEFTDRWCVQLLSKQMVRYFAGVTERHGVTLATRPGARTSLEPGTVSHLPHTALRRLDRWLPELPQVQALCMQAEPVGVDLVLVCHQVDATSPTR